MTKTHTHDDPRYAVHKTDDQWREQLSPMQYQVARHAATERAFTGTYWNHWDDGQYRCVGCGETLFESKTKFDAGCGWPSYYEPVNADVVERVQDETHGMVRVEVRCKQLRVAPGACVPGRARSPPETASASIRRRSASSPGLEPAAAGARRAPAPQWASSSLAPARPPDCMKLLLDFLPIILFFGTFKLRRRRNTEACGR